MIIVWDDIPLLKILLEGLLCRTLWGGGQGGRPLPPPAPLPPPSHPLVSLLPSGARNFPPSLFFSPLPPPAPSSPSSLPLSSLLPPPLLPPPSPSSPPSCPLFSPLPFTLSASSLMVNEVGELTRLSTYSKRNISLLTVWLKLTIVSLKMKLGP